MDKSKIPTPAFTREIVDELKKVTWPTRKETMKLTAVVIIVSLIIGIYIGIIDVFLTKSLELITQFR